MKVIEKLVIFLWAVYRAVQGRLLYNLLRCS